MNWQSISWNLVDARGEMSHMLARVQCAAFGKVCDSALEDWEELALQEERERPLGKHELYRSMNHIFGSQIESSNGSATSPTRRLRHRGIPQHRRSTRRSLARTSIASMSN